MAMYLRYRGEFYDLAGTVWRCDILQEANSAFQNVGVLDFPAVGALEIEYPSTELETPVCSSTAKLTIVSPGDRTFLDLYTIKPGQIRLDVYRSGSLFWSGTLDPEFYEEPYERGKDYDVSLTFSDFGILDRMPYDLGGRQTLRAILEEALSRSRVNYSSINEALISSQFEGGAAMTLSSLSIASENFFDEDGGASTFREALEGFLLPLSLRMIQRAGVIYVYDINGLYTKKATTKSITWDGASSKLGTNRVYNDIKVTFSPYSSSEAISGELEYGAPYGPEWTNLTTTSYTYVKYFGGNPPAGMEVPDCFSWYTDYDPAHRVDGWDYSLIDFTLFRSSDSSRCKGVAQIGGSNAYFKFLPVLGGQESEGVIGGFYPNYHSGKVAGNTGWYGVRPTNHTSNNLAFKTARAYLPALSANDAKLNYLRIRLPLLFDPRYNPFQSEGDYNEGTNYENVKSYGQFAFVPVAIVLYNANGQALYHYENSWLTQNGQPARNVASTADDAYSHLWGWKSGNASFGDCWLSYYDPEDLLEGSGVLGWKTNRQSFGKPWNDGRHTVSKRKFKCNTKSGEEQDFFIFDSFKKIPEGQFIPYPPEGGYLEIRVYNGVWAFDDTEAFNSNAASGKFQEQNLYDTIRWQMYQLPSVTVVKANLTFNDAEIDDVEYTGVANVDAKESLELETICGTALDTCPTAKGVFLKASDGQQISKLVRAGRTDHPEQLLIGTLYSQYANRKTTLSGEAIIDPDGLTLYTERAQSPNTKFLLTAEVMDVQANTSQMSFVEVRPDEYTGTES